MSTGAEFLAREWRDRARDMERERDAAEQKVDDERLRLLHELLATLDRDFAQVISPVDAWSEALIRVGELKRRAEQAEGSTSLLDAKVQAEQAAEAGILAPDEPTPYGHATTPGESDV